MKMNEDNNQEKTDFRPKIGRPPKVDVLSVKILDNDKFLEKRKQSTHWRIPLPK